ncbi:MAG TPA: hypothetical protein VFW30_04500 [Bryocella sp.]|nr:hypothetical protein [Bryocella sp.]
MEPVVEVKLVVEAVGLRVGEVHFADERGEITCSTELMGDGLVLWREGERPGALENIEVEGVKAGHEGGSRRPADGIAAVGVRESNTLLRERVEVRCMGYAITADAHAAALVLIGHENKHIRTAAVASFRRL